MSETQAEKTARIDQTVKTLAQDQTILWSEMNKVKQRIKVQEDWKLTSESGRVVLLKLAGYTAAVLTFLMTLIRELHTLAQVANTVGK